MTIGEPIWVTVFNRDGTPRTVNLRAAEDALTVREADGAMFCRFLLDPLHADTWAPGRAAGGDRLLEASAVVARALHYTDLGDVGRLPNSARLLDAWNEAPAATALILEPRGIALLFALGGPLREGQGERAHVAAQRVLAGWIVAHGMQPEEYGPGSWRPGLVPDVRAANSPIPHPRGLDDAGGHRDWYVLPCRPVRTFDLRELVAEAQHHGTDAAIVPPKARAAESRGPGLLGRVFGKGGSR